MGCAGGHARGGEGAGGAAVGVRPGRGLGQAPAGPGAGRRPGPGGRAGLAVRVGDRRGADRPAAGMAALQSWAGAGMLGVVRALIRDDDQPYLGRPRHGDLPDEWDDSLVHEIALALAVSVPSAARTTRAAWELAARLPGVELLLRDGTLDVPRARLVAEVFEELSDEDCARAEELLLPELTAPPRKTYTQIERIATAIAAAVDPGLAERRRKAAEKHRSRVTMFRERSGDGRAVGPGPADRPDPGRVRQRGRPRPAVQGLRRVPRRADRPAPGDGLPGHPQRPRGRRSHRLRKLNTGRRRRRRRRRPRRRRRRAAATPTTTARARPRRPLRRRRPRPGRVGLPLRRVRRPLRAARRQRLPRRRRTGRRRAGRWLSRGRRPGTRRTSRATAGPAATAGLAATSRATAAAWQRWRR